MKWLWFLISAMLLSAGCYSTSRADSPSIVTAEENELMAAVKTAFEARPQNRESYPLPLARPFSVRVSRKNATVNVTDPMGTNNLPYAEEWYEIYNRYHASRSQTVCMQIVWKRGSYYLYYPLDDLGLFPPKCPIK